MARQERMLYSIEHRDITSGFESCRRPFDYLSPPVCDVTNWPEARHRGGREGQLFANLFWESDLCWPNIYNGSHCIHKKAVTGMSRVSLELRGNWSRKLPGAIGQQYTPWWWFGGKKRVLSYMVLLVGSLLELMAYTISAGHAYTRMWFTQQNILYKIEKIFSHWARFSSGRSEIHRVGAILKDSESFWMSLDGE